jgi:hypothetical protein
MKRVLVLIAAALLAGCASIHPVAVDVFEKSSASYSIGEVQEKNIGEPLVEEANLKFHKAPVAVDYYQPPEQAGVKYPRINPGMIFEPYGRLDNGDILYGNTDLRPRTPNGKPVDWTYCIVINTEGEAYGDADCDSGDVRKWADAPKGIVLIRPVYREGSIKRELSYNGVSGSTIRLIYREYRNGSSTLAASDYLFYDLSASKTITFKKMEIEVLDATASNISYIVRSTLDGWRPEEAEEDPAIAVKGKSVYHD